MTPMPAIYQLVFQLPGSSQIDFEEMTGLDIFVHTESTIRLFESVRSLPGIARALPRMQVAFRQLDGEVYEVLHPPGLFRFTVALP